MEEEITRKFAIVAILVLIVTLVSMGFNNITGNVPSAAKVTGIVGEQLRYENGVARPFILVKLLPKGYTGSPGKLVDMQLVTGTKSMDVETQCDDFGPKSGSSECKNFEIATFNIQGTTWKNGERVTFKIRGTNIESRPLTIIK